MDHSAMISFQKMNFLYSSNLCLTNSFSGVRGSKEWNIRSGSPQTQIFTQQWYFVPQFTPNDPGLIELALNHKICFKRACG